MGWWKERFENKSIQVGDEPIGILVEMLTHFSRHYQDEIDRKPSFDEFRACLLHVIGAAPDDFFAKMESLEITAATFKTKSVPKTQPFKAGDYFAIPLDHRCYYFGRILWLGEACLVEVYDLKSSRPLTLAELLSNAKTVAFHKHVNPMAAFRRRRWPILGRKPIPRNFEFPPFYFGSRFTVFQIARGNKSSVATREEAIKLEPMVSFSPEEVEAVLRSGKFDQWPYLEKYKKDHFGT